MSSGAPSRVLLLSASQTVLVLAPDRYFEPAIRSIFSDVRRAIPSEERTRAMVLRAFLDSDLTLDDIKSRLGLKRRADVERMFIGPLPKKERETFEMLDGFERALNFVMDFELRSMLPGAEVREVPKWVRADEGQAAIGGRRDTTETAPSPPSEERP